MKRLIVTQFVVVASIAAFVTASALTKAAEFALKEMSK